MIDLGLLNTNILKTSQEITIKVNGLVLLESQDQESTPLLLLQMMVQDSGLMTTYMLITGDFTEEEEEKDLLTYLKDGTQLKLNTLKMVAVQI